MVGLGGSQKNQCHPPILSPNRRGGGFRNEECGIGKSETCPYKAKLEGLGGGGCGERLD